MLLLGHIGITVGLGSLLDFGLRRKYGRDTGEAQAATDAAEAVKRHPSTDPPRGAMAKLAIFMRDMDYRLLIVGSVLPDIIDKPIGTVFFRDFFSSGRIFAHSLLFLVIITLLGLYIYRRWRRRWLLILSFGTAVHLLLDQMWSTPGTILWPFLGWSFEKDDVTDWFIEMWHDLPSSPYAIATEAIGALVLVAVLVLMIRRKKLYTFIRYGKL